MESQHKGISTAPLCECKAGMMKTLCGTKKAQHPGRYFYKCPLDLDHKGSFLWCDEYHSKDPRGLIPEFVKNQKWKPKAVDIAETSTSSFVPYHVPVHQVDSSLKVSPEMFIAFNFMAIVIFCLGMIFGKLVG